ncbi:aminodeoxychorismate/anthranilate synthase component II [Desulfurella sp.]|uniref:anthranilate synthase component II n=1 Tax=Desulfurella sp. TaxID=1962857 RepID=UPI0025BDE09D|nr:aminodeoxychorismate/anthranilate synthase component II [Desulfurella sp.]
MRKINVLLIDNTDSFTYNIVDYLRKMDNLKTKIIQSNKISPAEVSDFDKIIISPGPGLPKDFPIIYEIIKEYHTSKHILGICLGYLAIGSFFGANLVNIFPVVHGQAHKIKVVKQSPIFKNIPKTLKVGLYHSWAIDHKNFPKELEITAVSENGVIMSISSKKFNIFGVQFHPESYITQYGFNILKNFIDIT